MSKLLQRLQDASRSGVYRVRTPEPVADALRGSALDLARISLRGADGKEAVLRALGEALGFPSWFGGNWDALEDCLCDLSWRPGEGHVLVFEDFELGDEFGILLDVLASVAEFWAARGRPFFAVFVDPQRSLALAELFRER
jgi:RNAse (barnase) inhibitor barstar